jgi:hypothetical protein
MKYASNFTKIFFATAIFYLLCDFLFGNLILEKFYWKDKEDFRVEHDIYHHTIKPNFDGFAYFGGKKYKFCSDGSGFKSSCKDVGTKKKNFDIGIIGDSFSEGIGIPYENTFIGIINKNLKDKSVANLAVTGYSTSIYYIKIKTLLENGYHFDEIIIYIDLNDIHNEANAFKIVNNKIEPIGKKKNTIDYLNNPDTTEKQNYKNFFRKKFKFTYENLHLIKMLIFRYQNKGIFPYVKNLEIASWPYDKDAKGYGEQGVNASIEKAKKSVIQLMDLLDEKKIKYSVGVYPYPQSMFYDQVNSRHVKIWEEVCLRRCKNFFNNFPNFFNVSSKIGPIETYYKYYIYRDTHFNENGHEMIAKNFLEIYDNE